MDFTGYVSESLLPSREHVRETAFEAFQDALEQPQADALPALLKPVEGSQADARFARELFVSHLASALAQKVGKLLIERLSHEASLPQSIFRM